MSISLTQLNEERANRIQQNISARAQSMGMKSSNLEELREVAANLNAKDPNLKINIPSFNPIAHTPIATYLNDHAPEWQKLWFDFVEAQTLDTRKEKEFLTPLAIEKLKALQALIQQTFANPEKPFKNEALENYLKQFEQADLLMVRSTGKEDNVDFANPGGNESVAAVAPTLPAVSQAMGIVVASYFSEKSITQRLLSKDKVTTEPFMPVLLQKMIGEPLEGEKNPDSIVRSGVIYTSEGGIRIDVAPGHGELIVNSKGPFDTYYVSSENVSHEQRFQKPYRLVPSETDELDTRGQKKRKLHLAKNPPSVISEASLSTLTSQKIAKIARGIQEHYGRDMDLEFVYDPKKDTVYLVQARPITMGDLSLEMPRSIPPEKMADFKKLKLEGQIDSEAGQMVSPGKAIARVATQKSEILVADTIGNALKIYLTPPPKNIKGVIIRELSAETSSAETSHEAAFFNSKKISVIQVNNLKKIEEWLEIPQVVLLIDPQRSQVVNWTQAIRFKQEPEKELVEAGWLRKGIFKSPIKLMETPSKLGFEKFKGLADLKLQAKKVNLSKEKVGDLIQKAQSAANETIRIVAFNQLMQLLYSSISNLPMTVFKLDEKESSDLIKSSIESIEIVTPETVNQAKQGINNLLLVFVKLAKSKAALEKNSPHYALFRTALINCAELTRLLDSFALAEKNVSEKERIQKEIQQLAGSLETLIYNPGAKGLIAESIKQIKQEELALKKALEIPGAESLNEEERRYFIELMKLQKIALNPEFSKEWAEFALAACQDPQSRPMLASMIKFSLFNMIESDWINDCFARHMRATKDYGSNANQPKLMTTLFQLAALQQTSTSGSALKKFPTIKKLKMRQILKAMKNEGLQTAKELEKLNFTDKFMVLHSWEDRIVEWSDPNKFDTLFRDLNKELVPFIDQLQLSSVKQPMSKKALLKTVQWMTDIIDRTIKSLKGSPDYPADQLELQVQRFTQLLDIYYTLMKIWILQIPDSTLVNWARQGGGDLDYNRDKTKMLTEIRKVFDGLKDKNQAEQLAPSGTLTVSSARVDSGASFLRQFMNKPLTKEDLFSFFHQNILAATTYLGQETRLNIKDLPETLRPYIEAMANIQANLGHMEILSIEHRHPKLIFDMNLGLKNHSAKFLLTYDTLTHQIQFEGKVFGHNANRRMDIIAEVSHYDAKYWGMKQSKPAQYVEKSFTLEFNWQFDATKMKDNIVFLCSAIRHYGHLTFYQDDYLFTLMKRHPGKEAEIMNEFKNNFAFNLALSKDILKNYKDNNQSGYSKAATIAWINNLSNPLLAQLFKENLLDIKLFKSILDEYQPSFNFELKDQGETCFESIAKVLPIDHIPNFVETFNIDLSRHPNLLNIALSRNNAQLYEYFKTKGVVLNAFDGPALKGGMKDPSLAKIIIEELRSNPEKHHISKQPDLIRSILYSVLEPDQQLKLAHEMLDIGVPFNAMNPAVMSKVPEFPELFKRYKDHIQSNFSLYSEEQKSDLLKACLTENESEELAVFLAEMKFPLQNASYFLDILYFNHLENPTVRQHILEILGNNTKKGEKPDLSDALTFEKSHMSPGAIQLRNAAFDYALEHNIKTTIPLWMFINIAQSRHNDPKFKAQALRLCKEKFENTMIMEENSIFNKYKALFPSEIAWLIPELLGTGKISFSQFDLQNWLWIMQDYGGKNFFETTFKSNKDIFISQLLTELKWLVEDPSRLSTLKTFNEIKNIPAMQEYRPYVFQKIETSLLEPALRENNIEGIKILLALGCTLKNENLGFGILLEIFRKNSDPTLWQLFYEKSENKLEFLKTLANLFSSDTPEDRSKNQPILEWLNTLPEYEAVKKSAVAAKKLS